MVAWDISSPPDPEHWSFSPIGLASPCSGRWTFKAQNTGVFHQQDLFHLAMGDGLVVFDEIVLTTSIKYRTFFT